MLKILWLISAPKDTIKTLRHVWMFLTKIYTPYYTGSVKYIVYFLSFDMLPTLACLLDIKIVCNGLTNIQLFYFYIQSCFGENTEIHKAVVFFKLYLIYIEFTLLECGAQRRALRWL